MENEADKLQRDLRRYRYLLSHTTDPSVGRILQELIAEAQARLRTLEQRGTVA